jgi:hypothetical protein
MNSSSSTKKVTCAARLALVAPHRAEGPRPAASQPDQADETAEATETVESAETAETVETAGSAGVAQVAEEATDTSADDLAGEVEIKEEGHKPARRRTAQKTDGDDAE